MFHLSHFTELWVNFWMKCKQRCIKTEVFIKDLFSKCDQICRKLQIWSQLLKKSLMENFSFCAVEIKYFGDFTFKMCQIKFHIQKEKMLGGIYRIKIYKSKLLFFVFSRTKHYWLFSHFSILLVRLIHNQLITWLSVFVMPPTCIHWIFIVQLP